LDLINPLDIGSSEALVKSISLPDLRVLNISDAPPRIQKLFASTFRFVQEIDIRNAEDPDVALQQLMDETPEFGAWSTVHTLCITCKERLYHGPMDLRFTNLQTIDLTLPYFDMFFSVDHWLAFMALWRTLKCLKIRVDRSVQLHPIRTVMLQLGGAMPTLTRIELYFTPSTDAEGWDSGFDSWSFGHDFKTAMESLRPSLTVEYTH
jgi:hypothetical protein